MYKKLPQCVIVLRCTKCTHDQHKCVWNGEKRNIVEGEVEIQKRSKRVLMQSAKVIESSEEEEIRFVGTC
jgi:hypothetical protein